MTLSFRQLFALLFITFVGLLAATALQAWTGPTATAPGGNVAAPINVSDQPQVKNGGLSLNSLLVSGNAAIYNSAVATKLGINTASPVVALDVNGTIKIANGGEVCQSVDAGAIRYNSTSNSLEYCNGNAWTALGGSAAGGPSAIRVFTSSGTWTRPAGVTKVVVYVTGGGGGGGGGSVGSNGTTGGTSSFGTYASATGGGGGTSDGSGGAGGSGSGGDINLTGQGGKGSMQTGDYPGGLTDFPGYGGVSFWDGTYGTGGNGSGQSYYYNGGGGGAGGTAIKVLDVSSISSVPVTVGAGNGFGNATGGVVVVYEYSGSSGSGGSSCSHTQTLYVCDNGGAMGTSPNFCNYMGWGPASTLVACIP